jgi:hypothetical protein
MSKNKRWRLVRVVAKGARDEAAELPTGAALEQGVEG